MFVHSHEASTCERLTNKMSVSLNRWEKNCYVSNVIHIVCFHWSFKLVYFLFFIVALKDDLNRLKASMWWFIFGIWCIQWVYQWIYSLLYQKLINKYIYGFDNHKINGIKKNAHTQIKWMNDAFNAGFGMKSIVLYQRHAFKLQFKILQINRKKKFECAILFLFKRIHQWAWYK